MLATLRWLARISDRAARRAFLVKQTIRNLYWSLVLFVGFWISNRERLDWLLACVVIVALPDWIHLLVKRRMAPGSLRDRILIILDYFVLT
jgi:hypothetical protein